MKHLPFLLALALPLAADVPDEQSFACDSTEGFQSSTAEGTTFLAERGNLVLSYERAKIAPLANYALMTGLRELHLKIRSVEEGTFVAVVKDRDGATWNAAFKLRAREWEEVVLTPDKFALNTDSPVKKPAIEPARLGWGWVLIDAAAIKGGTGRNELRVDTVRIVREPVAMTLGALFLMDEHEIGGYGGHEGELTFQGGAKAHITSPIFRVDGSLTLDDSEVVFDGGVVEIVQRFPHERTILLKGNSKLTFRNALIITRFPAKLTLEKTSALEMDATECVGGFTCDVPEKGRVTLKSAQNPGEFVIAPGGTVEVDSCRNVILWLALGANLKGPLTFPGASIDAAWHPGNGLNVSVARSTEMKWGLLSLPGSDGSVTKCDPAAAGLLFGNKDHVTLDGVQNGKPLASWKVPSPDRKLAFTDTKVGAWNVYASDECVVRVTKSTIGEAMAFKRGRIDLEDTTVDGTGGYVGAHDDSVIRLERCKITCLVVAHQNARIELVDCDVKGDVRAVDEGRVTLSRSTVSGKIEADTGAAIERN